MLPAIWLKIIRWTELYNKPNRSTKFWHLAHIRYPRPDPKPIEFQLGFKISTGLEPKHAQPILQFDVRLDMHVQDWTGPCCSPVHSLPSMVSVLIMINLPNAHACKHILYTGLMTSQDYNGWGLDTDSTLVPAICILLDCSNKINRCIGDILHDDQFNGAHHSHCK